MTVGVQGVTLGRQRGHDYPREEMLPLGSTDGTTLEMGRNRETWKV